VVVSFIGGGNWRKPLTCLKSLRFLKFLFSVLKELTKIQHPDSNSISEITLRLIYGEVVVSMTGPLCDQVCQ
jgi:hypothetical protein